MLSVRDSANFPGGMSPQAFQILSQTWTGEQLPLPHDRTGRLFPVVGWSGNPGQAAPIHVVRARWWPMEAGWDRGPLPTPPTEVLLVYGGDAGVRILDGTTEPMPGVDEDLPRGQGLPWITLGVGQLAELPPEVQAVVRQRVCDRCGAPSGDQALCALCAQQGRPAPDLVVNCCAEDHAHRYVSPPDPERAELQQYLEVIEEDLKITPNRQGQIRRARMLGTLWQLQLKGVELRMAIMALESAGLQPLRDHEEISVHNLALICAQWNSFQPAYAQAMEIITTALTTPAEKQEGGQAD